jgi:uncharacterized protein (TIGR03437 family)
MRLTTLTLAAALLLLESAGAQTVTFDFDNASPALVTGQNLPFDQTAGSMTAHFSSPQGAVFSVQSDATTGWKLSQFSGNYLYDNNQNRNVLQVQFSSRISAVSLTFATADFQQAETPTTIQVTAYLDSTASTPVGTATAHGVYGSDTMPMGTLSFDSGAKPFNLIEITIPYQPLGATAFFVDNVKVKPVSAAGVFTSVSAATFQPGQGLAPGMMVAGFGSGLSSVTAPVTALPLPTSLGGVSVIVKDSAGSEQAAPLLFVSPGQINYIVPSGAAPGAATVTVTNQGAAAAAGAVQIDSVAPGLFSANANGTGVAAAGAIRVAPDGTQTWQLVYQCGQQQGSCAAVPIDMGSATDDVILVLFGTGIRGGATPPVTTATIGGVPAEVLYSGAQPTLPGLDQVNVRLPRALAGSGQVGIVLTVDGRQSNTVTVLVP